jgi:hypothetical protein
MTEPVLSGTGSLHDRIIAGLESQGFIVGTITDREIDRLEAKTLVLITDGFSIADLYRIAGEPMRIVGEK